MFSELRRLQLTRKARMYIIQQRRIPLDLYQQLADEGIDISELERNARNGA